ncbi:MAG: hypothetical protein K0R28_3450, partial [Paenibacillus sp.]|nr:hypothetical protein [Paenibacillus sp.]
MVRKILFTSMIFLLIILQIWFGYLHLRYPFLGIDLTLSKEGDWIVKSIARETTGMDIKIGDIIYKVNGKDPNEHMTVKKWRSVEQADSVEVIRDGMNIVVDLKGVTNSIKRDVLPIVAELLCFTVATLLYVKVRNSKSAILLSLIFFNIGITFMSLAGSARGDGIAKLMLAIALPSVTIAFLHFLTAFFKEKCGLKLKLRMVFILYVFVTYHASVCFFWLWKDTVDYTTYRLNVLSILVTFLLGIILSFGALFYLFFRHRKETSNIASIIRFVITSMIVSFLPVISLSFIPKIMYGDEFVSSYITSWFVLIFPLAFAYLIITKQIYDIHMVLRRVLFTVIMALVPSLVVTGLNIALFYDHLSVRKTILFFSLSLVILTFVLYSAEHMYTRMERLMFPRKYFLQAALKKIAKDLTSASSFRDLKDLILVDIVNTLEVYGGAIVFKYRDSTEIISEGDISESEVDALVQREKPFDHPDYICIEINKHEEHTSYLVMTQKRSNTLLVLEEVQWLNLIVSYLAVSLENVYLIRKLTDKLNRMASQSTDEQETQD